MINLSYRNITKRIKIITALLCSILIISGCSSYNAEITWELEEDTSACEEVLVEESLVEETPEMIYVYVNGAVNNGGLYILPKGSRLYEAIEVAGGMTAEADPYYHNQARLLEDGEQIIIWTTEQTSHMDENANRNPVTDSGLVNINTANVEQLMQLSGIGETRAEAIVTYRETCGRFASIEDIQNVSGIKERLYEKIKDKITVG